MNGEMEEHDLSYTGTWRYVVQFGEILPVTVAATWEALGQTGHSLFNDQIQNVFSSYLWG